MYITLPLNVKEREHPGNAKKNLVTVFLVSEQDTILKDMKQISSERLLNLDVEKATIM